MESLEYRQIWTIITRRQPELLPILRDMEHTALTIETREALREAIADELIENGLDADDQPTPFGLELENLIDWLGHR